jgi:hypothetical protein
LYVAQNPPAAPEQVGEVPQYAGCEDHDGKSHGKRNPRRYLHHQHTASPFLTAVDVELPLPTGIMPEGMEHTRLKTVNKSLNNVNVTPF